MLHIYLTILVVFIGALLPIFYLLRKIYNLEEKVTQCHIESMSANFRYEIAITNQNYLKAMILTNMYREDKQKTIEHIRKEIEEVNESSDKETFIEKTGVPEYDEVAEYLEKSFEKISRKINYQTQVNYNDIINYLNNNDEIDYNVIASKLNQADGLE